MLACLWAGMAVSGWAQETNNEPGTETPVGVVLTSPPSGLVLAAPLTLPVIAEVSTTAEDDVTVEFLDGETSLGTVDAPFGVLPQVDGAGNASGPYVFSWVGVPVGNHAVSAVVWQAGEAVARTEVATFEVVGVEGQVEVNVLLNDPAGAEGGDDVEFIIERNGDTDSELEVFFEWDGTATLDSDVLAVSGSVRIPAGERQVPVTAQIIDDSDAEGAETLTLRILPPVCLAIFPPEPDCYLVGNSAEATASIRDNDLADENVPPLVALVAPVQGQTFREGQSVPLEAHAWDTENELASISFFVGERLLGTVTVTPDDATTDASPGVGQDGLPLPPMRVIASWEWTSEAAGRYQLSAVAEDAAGNQSTSNTVVVGVASANLPPVVTIESPDDEASEGSETGNRPVEVDSGLLVISRTGDMSSALTVGLEIGGSATTGRDYRRLPTRVTIPRGSASVRVEVVPVDDRLVEGPETVIVAIRPSNCEDEAGRRSQCYRVGRASRQQVTILDNDRGRQNQPPRVAIVRPRDGVQISDTETVTLIAEAVDPDGNVASVEFFANADSVGMVEGNGNNGNGRGNRFYRVSFRNPPPGRYQVVAVATDDDGDSTRSEPIQVNVGPTLLRATVEVVAVDPIASERGAEPNPRPGQPGNAVAGRRNTATFWITRRGLLDVALEVGYRVTGRAENGVDYRELSGTVSLDAGQTRAAVVVDPIDDAEVEGREDVILELTPFPCIAIFPPPPDCYVFGRSQRAVAVILDDDRAENRAPRIALANPADGEEFRAPADLRLIANAQDADGWVRRVTFLANGDRIGRVNAERDADDVVDQPQTFALPWTNVRPGRYALVAVAEDNRGAETRSEPVMIAVLPGDVDPVGTVVSVEAIDPRASEGAPSNTTPVDVGVLRFTRTGDLSVPLPVSYRIGGSAINGRDYVGIRRRFEFDAGESQVDVLVEPIDDNRVEGTETVTVALVVPPCIAIFPPPPECYTLGDSGVATVRIFDNDEERNLLPRVAIVQPRQRSVFQQPADVVVRVEALDRDGWVGHMRLFAGEELIGERTLNFFREPDPGDRYRFDFVWENAPAGVHELTAVATDDQGDTARSRPVTIRVVAAEDLPVVHVLARDAAGSEPVEGRRPDNIQFRVWRSGLGNEALTVSYEVRGTATPGEDYTALEGTVTIPAGRRWAAVDVVPLADEEAERTETVVLRLVPNDAYAIGRIARAGAVIRGNNRMLAGSERLSDGNVHIAIPAPNGQSFRVESATNFAEWEVIGTNTVTDDAIHIVDTESTDTEVRFFRIIADVDPEAEED